MSQETPYELIGKEKGLKALVSAFYSAMDKYPQARDVRNMHRETLKGMEQKLFEYLSGWLGGPQLYLQNDAHLCLIDQHKVFAITSEAGNQWLFCWEKAMDATNMDAKVREMVEEPIERIVDFLVNQ